METENKYRIRAKSVMGWPVWLTGVSEPVDTGEGVGPIVSMVNSMNKGKRFTKAEADALLPQVKPTHPEAEIVPAPDRPRVICLCGSTRFIDEFAITQWNLELNGFIVLGCTLLPQHYCDVPDHFAEKLGCKEKCDELHKRKIDLADEVYVLNIGGYIGESTRSEIEYAVANGKRVVYREALAEGKP